MIVKDDFLSRLDVELAGAATPAEVADLRRKFLGKKSEFAEERRSLGSLSENERRARGAELNELLSAAEARFETRNAGLAFKRNTDALLSDSFDPTLPGTPARAGSLHPISIVERRCIDVLRRFGFEVADGPEVETAYYNFDALNVPEHHPARELQDTFWLESGLLLRSHTTTIQARVLAQKPELPVKIVASGRVYRNEAVDATHLAMFHQLEGFWVEDGLQMSHLLGLIKFIAKELFGGERAVRFKPKYYPYTEPSIGLDVACNLCNGNGCAACHSAGWVTVIGAGMIHPNVLKEFGYDRPGLRGFAFGWGTTRLTAQRIGLDHVRALYSTNRRVVDATRGRLS